MVHLVLAPYRCPKGNVGVVELGLLGRKTIKAGPFRMTVSKSGLSTSVGGKRGRVRLNPKGRATGSLNLGRGVRVTRSKKF